MESPVESPVEIGRKVCVGSVGGRGQSSHHEDSRARERGDPLTAQVSKSALHEVPRHGGAHGLADHQTDLRLLDPGVHVEVDDQGPCAGSATAPNGL